MAEINIERKPAKSPWPLIIALLLGIALAVGAWYFMRATSPSERTLPADTAITTLPPRGMPLP